MNKHNKNGLLLWFENHLNVVIVVSLLLIIVLPFVLSLPAFCGFFELHEGHNVGDAIGGITAPIIGIVSILLLFYTLRAQKDAEYRSSLENRIFQLIGLHRKNVEDMHSEARNISGQDVFKLIYDQIYHCIKDITPFFENRELASIIKDEFLVSLKDVRPGIDVFAFAKIDIAYSAVYVGVRDEYLETLRSLLTKRYHEDFISQILLYLRLCPVSNDKQGVKEWNNLKQCSVSDLVSICKAIREMPDIDDKELHSIYPRLSSNQYKKYYWGHEFRLGHYFRHLYATVEYIDSQQDLSTADKIDYVKLLRTQLSNTEQIIFMANSISDMGGAWELFRKQKDGTPLITTYNLIKNITLKEVYGVPYRSFYPDVDYELGESLDMPEC